MAFDLSICQREFDFFRSSEVVTDNHTHSLLGRSLTDKAAAKSGAGSK